MLLKNSNGTLPLSRDIKTIAVIGPNAASHEVLVGNYNSIPKDPVSLLEGIKAKTQAGDRGALCRGK